MTDLYWPGDERAGALMGDVALLEAMVRVEDAWLARLVTVQIAPESARTPLVDLVGPGDVESLAAGAGRDGNPVTGLVALLRERVGERNREAARWLHRGLTSQDVLDTALMLCAADAVGQVRSDLLAQVERLADLVRQHRQTPMVARTLTQHAVPTTFGLKAAAWLTGLLDAYDAAAALGFPVQVGGAAGTMAAVVELVEDREDPFAIAEALGRLLSEDLLLDDAPPWHTWRGPVTRIGDAAVRANDAWGRIANDVLTLSRPEIGELREGTGGGSSTMPHKANPVLSVLVRRAALAAPQLGGTLHLAAAESVDERADGGWHVEWATLRTLLRRTVVAASQTTALLHGLQVRPERMAATLAAAHDEVRAEQRSIADLVGRAPSRDYVGAAPALLDVPLARATELLDRVRTEGP